VEYENPRSVDAARRICDCRSGGNYARNDEGPVWEPAEGALEVIVGERCRVSRGGLK